MASRKIPKKRIAKRAPKAKARQSPLIQLCRSLPGTTEDIKWGDDLVFSVGNKMYAAFDLDATDKFGFKSEEEEFMGLIQIEGIIPAPYLARHFWVKVENHRALPNTEWKRLLKKAHGLILAKLPIRTQSAILQS